MHDVIVVGGGLAGLAAARDLRKAGHGVLVIEARDRLGGRTWYREMAGTDYHIELGGTWFDPETQRNIGTEVERYGLPTILSPEGVNLRSVLDGQPLEPDEIPVPAEFRPDLDRALGHVIELSRRVTFGEPARDPALSDLDVAFADLLSPLNLPTMVGDYMNMWAGFAFGCHPREVSALQVLTWVAGYENEVWSLNDAPATKFASGTVSLVDAMAADGAPEIAFGTAVVSIDKSSSGVTVVAADGTAHPARAAILATPVNTWSDIEIRPISAAKAALAGEGQAGHGVKVWAVATGLPEYLIASGWGGPLNWVSEQNHDGGERLVVGIGHDSALLDPTDLRAVERAIRDFVPEANLVAADGHDWTTDPYAKGTWMAYRPGQLTTYHDTMAAAEEPLFFAGSDIAPGWAGFMDGALESGRLVAAAVDAFLA